MAQEGETIKINCILKGEAANKFLAIKKRRSLENDTEVVRLAISEFYDLLFPEKVAQVNCSTTPAV